MRRLSLIASAAIVIGCSDRTPSTAPEIDQAQPDVPTAATTSEAIVPTPVDGDRILIDTRTTLQQATSKAQAIDAFGSAASLSWLWYFTSNVDGQGTNALRIDWPKRPRAWCTYQTASLIANLPTPRVNRVVVQWKHHLGRTATGGGFGSVGAFSLVDHGCPEGRRVGTLHGESDGDGAHHMTYEWTGAAPIAPVVIRPGTPPLRIDALTGGVPLEEYVGRTIVQTLYVQAESAPGASDGVVAALIDDKLVLVKTALPLAVSQFGRITFAGRSPLSLQRQSEYFWDVLVWEPAGEFPIPSDVPPGPPVVGSLTVIPESARLNVGSTINLVATVRDTDGDVLTGHPVTWQSSDDAIASVSANGLVTGRTVGGVTITATAGGKSGTSAITVDPASPVPVASVEVSPATANVQVGAAVQLTAVARDAAGNALPGRAITWSSGSTGIATVSESGLVTGVAAGEATITATSEGISGSATVTVTTAPPPPVASVSVAPATASVQVGATVQLAATLRDAAGNVLTGRTVTWTTSAGGVATVSATGLVTGVAVGGATITATSEGKSGTAAITVTPVPVATVTVAPATASVPVGSTVQLSATLRDASGNVLTGRVVTWSTSASAVATVSGTGLVLGVTAGPATITATSESKSGTSAITVTAPPPDATPPSTPQNLAAVAVSPTQVNLSWSASTDNVGVTGYRVFRNGTQVGTPTVPAFQDGNLTPSTTYSYTVAAVDATGNVSPQSAAVSVTTPGTGGIGTALPVRLAQSTGTVFYVAPNGSNTNPGTLVAPWQTIQKALSTLQPGQKAYVRAGTYREALTLNRAGTASAPITIEAYPGEKPIIDGELVRRPLVIESGGAYFRIKGFILDRDCCTSGGHIDVYGHHIEIVGNEMRNGRGKGVYTDEGSTFVHIIDNWIHHNVTVGGQQDHGIYLQGNDHFVANNVIHDHPDGFGIQIYDKGTRMIVVNNTVTNNGHSGIVVGGSGGVSNVTIRNNILANNNFYGVQHDSSCPTSNVVVDNNVIFGNGDGGVQSGCSAISATNNSTGNPLFVNPGTTSSRDLRVQAGSPAINAARVDYAMPTAFGGAARDLQPDIGAYEFGVSP
jgi:uncharacterized protein YjdB